MVETGSQVPEKDFKVKPKIYDHEEQEDFDEDAPGIDRRTLVAGTTGALISALTRGGGEYLARKAEIAKSKILTQESLQIIDDYAQGAIDMALAEARVAKEAGQDSGEYALAVLNEFRRNLEEKINNPQASEPRVDADSRPIPMPEIDNSPHKNDNTYY